MAGFVTVVLLGGLNLVAVKFSNQGLPPFYGAAVRFLIAAALMFAFVLIRRIPLPKGRELTATMIYGVLGFAGFYAFGYWALVTLPAAAAGVLIASAPLITVLLASWQKVETLTARGLTGAVLTILGIAVMVGSPTGGVVTLGAVLAVLAAAACDAEALIVVKKMPTGDPVSTNAVAMMFGAILLFALSLVARERWSVPTDTVTLAALAYLVVLGSIALFVVYLRTLKRWTASGMSYMFVLMPVVAAVLGYWLLDEPITQGVVLGGLIVLLGVYVGALSGGRASERS
ncbi:MAG: EamA family transporter [Actinomycetota bacterium]